MVAEAEVVVAVVQAEVEEVGEDLEEVVAVDPVVDVVEVGVASLQVEEEDEAAEEEALLVEVADEVDNRSRPWYELKRIEVFWKKICSNRMDISLYIL